MRILYILNDTLKRGGTESVVLGYSSALKKQNIVIDFMLHTTEDEAASNEIVSRVRADGFTVYTVTPRRISISQNKSDILRVLKDNKYDIVHAHADCANYLLLKYAKKAGVKVRIAHSHNTNIPIKCDSLKNVLHYLYLEYCRKSVCRVSTHTMACSYEAAVWLFGSARVADTYFLHNAIDIDSYQFNLDIREKVRRELDTQDKKVVGHVGRLNHIKNQSFLIDAFARLCEADRNYKLLLVGEGEDLLDLRKKVEELKLTDSVIFFGGSDKVNELLQSMDIFVFPSKWEGLSLSLIEAQAAGINCLVPDIKTISRESDVTGNVIRINSTEPEIWADIIKENVVDETTRVTNREDVRHKIAASGYSLETEAAKLKAYYTQLL